MSLSVEQIMTAMQGVLEGASWSGVTPPAFVRRGAVVPGDLSLPGLGIIQDEAQEDGGSLAQDDYLATFRWQVARSLGLEQPEAILADLLKYRDAMRDLARTAIDSRWGLGDMIGATNVQAWRAWMESAPAQTAVMEITMTIPVYDILDIILQPLTASLIISGGVNFRVLSAEFPDGSIGILTVRVLEYPSMVQVGIGESSDGNPVNGPAITDLVVGQQYTSEFKTVSTSDGYIDQTEWQSFYGPWVQPTRLDTINDEWNLHKE